MFTANTIEERIWCQVDFVNKCKQVGALNLFHIHSQDVIVVEVGKFRITLKVTVKGCTMNRISGGVVSYPIDPSNFVIKQSNVDENRTSSLEKRKRFYNHTKAGYIAQISN